MNAQNPIITAGWHEFRAGLGSGVLNFTFIALTLYLAVSLTNAEYLQQLGVTEVSRNGATVIYLMVTGFMFFLFFAWAWIFAQPILRDRNALLHEVVFTAPVSLKKLLCGRYLGALALATLLSSSILVGFLIAPLLETFGVLPKGSFAPTPWLQMGFSLLWILLPTAAGVGAIYLMATIATRSIAGPMAAAVVIVLFWMFCIVVLGGGDINLELAKVLDPSLFSLSKLETDLWTPVQKESALLPISADLLINRFIWAVLPLLALIGVIALVQRERLISVRETSTHRSKTRTQNRRRDALATTSAPLSQSSWLSVFIAEMRWQSALVLRSRVLWIAVVLLVAIGMTNAFVNVIWHADGPLLPDPGRTSKALNQSLYIVIVFIVAGTAGYIARRDTVQGIDDMLDALSTPVYLRLTARAVAVILTVVTLTIAPALSAVFSTLLVAPNLLDASFAFVYQALVIAPAQLEIAMVVFFAHALVRRTGLAYAVSIFLVAILIANHELELVDYPPFELGMPLRISFSPLTAWSAWLDNAIVLAVFKLGLCVLLVAFAAIVLPRGLDPRRHQLSEILRQRAAGIPGAVGLGAVLMLGATLGVMDREYKDNGGYRTATVHRVEDAAWEQRWLALRLGGDPSYRMDGGDLLLRVDPSAQTVSGLWSIENFSSAEGRLYGTVPDGISDLSVDVDGRSVQVDLLEGLFNIALGECVTNECDITLRWIARSEGWSTTAEAPWATAAGVWATTQEVAPSLGLDSERVLRAEAQRRALGLSPSYELPKRAEGLSTTGIAPSAAWSWRIELSSEDSGYTLAGPNAGVSEGTLALSVVVTSELQLRSQDGVLVHSAANDEETARQVASDVVAMRECVDRRLETDILLTDIVRMPAGGVTSMSSGSVLNLAEDPHWQVQAGGTGQLLRRAEIARQLAKASLADRFDLRRSSADVWVSEGVAGAIGLLCVADSDGLPALAKVLNRYSSLTTRALAASEIPVAELSDAHDGGWVRDYAPVAALAWVAKQTPAELTENLNKLGNDLPRSAVLASWLGPREAEAALGSPWSSKLELLESENAIRVSGKRQHWQDGGWSDSAAPVRPHALYSRNGRVRLSERSIGLLSDEEARSEALLLIDDWPSYQPSFVFLPSTDTDSIPGD